MPTNVLTSKCLKLIFASPNHHGINAAASREEATARHPTWLDWHPELSNASRCLADGTWNRNFSHVIAAEQPHSPLVDGSLKIDGNVSLIPALTVQSRAPTMTGSNLWAVTDLQN